MLPETNICTGLRLIQFLHLQWCCLALIDVLRKINQYSVYVLLFPSNKFGYLKGNSRIVVSPPPPLKAAMLSPR